MTNEMKIEAKTAVTEKAQMIALENNYGVSTKTVLVRFAEDNTTVPEIPA